MIPYREWRPLDFLVLTGTSDDNNPGVIGDWNDTSFSDYGYVGDWVIHGGIPPALSMGHSRMVARPAEESFASLEGLTDPIDYWIEFQMQPRVATELPASADIISGIQSYPASPNKWDKDLATGKYYDGTNPWGSYPPIYWLDGYTQSAAVSSFANGSSIKRIYGCAYRLGVGAVTHMNRAAMFRNGYCFYVSNYYHPTKTWPSGFSAGASGVIDLNPIRALVRFFNPVVNDLSIHSAKPAGGQSLILTGLGFNNDDDEITNATLNPSNSTPIGGWHDDVREILFIGINGEGTYTLTSAGGDFTVDSNTQITIAALPAMVAGTYEMKLRKTGLYTHLSEYVYAYAGDFRTDATGRVRAGDRMYFAIKATGGGGGDDDDEKKTIILTKWKFRKKDGTYIFKNYAPIDTVTAPAFFEGRILSLSSVDRSVSDRTGLYSASDMTIHLANHDREISKILAQYFLKNQAVLLYLNPNTGSFNPTPAAAFIVNDYGLKGTDFEVTLKDILAKYFNRKVPLYRCTKDIYPNIDANAVNKPMPEVLGVASYTEADNGGAVEAVYVNTVTHSYLAARGSLHAIPRVYADGVLVASSHYAVSYADGGRTYITFTTNKKEAKITFDAEGYMYSDWNSVNGYVQNPAYIMLFYLCFLLEIPPDDIDFDSFATIAAKFVASGFETSGFLILQAESAAEDVQGELNFSYGVLTCFDSTNRFKAVMLDFSSLAGAYTLFAQIDTNDFPDRKFNLNAAVNKIRASWNYNAAGELFAGGKSVTRPSSIVDFEVELESESAFEFRWTTSEALVDKRTTDELLKLGYGSPEISFNLSSEFNGKVDVLDIFRLQDPFGVSSAGTGDVGRYCMIIGISFDPGSGSLGIKAIDLAWLLRQYFIFGDEGSLPVAWTSATDEQRIFGYLCSEVTGKFSDGEPGKVLVDEN